VIKLLLVGHLLLATVLLGAATFHLAWAANGARSGGRRLVAILAAAYVIEFAAGNLLYPNYRVHVRAAYLDSPQAVAEATSAEATPGSLVRVSSLGWVSHLFDVKEQLIAVGLAPLLGLLALSLAGVSPGDRSARVLYLGLSSAITLCVWSGAAIGLYVTSIRSVG
jgi:hypothetical protein